VEALLVMTVHGDELPIDSDEERDPAPDPLRSLVERAAAGDEQAMRRLLGELGRTIAGVVHGVLGSNHPDAPDVTQEAMVAFVRALGPFRGECDVRHYAKRIAVRVSMAARRKLASDLARKQGQDADSLAIEAPDAMVDAAASRRRALLRELLADLPESQAEALVLRVVLGLSLEDAAASAGAPVNTIRSRLRLAREALKRRIEQDTRWAELSEESL
jgi:RNA polymerase sigma factor (sigma-70 family)